MMITTTMTPMFYYNSYNTQRTCLCFVDIKKITTQQAATQCDVKHDGKKLKNPHAKKMKERKSLMERENVLTCRL